jgi:hypothetical protein
MVDFLTNAGENECGRTGAETPADRLTTQHAVGGRERMADPSLTRQIPFVTLGDIRRFASYIVRGESCWEWSGPRTPDGYGQFGLAGDTFYAHRISWVLQHGQIPSDRPIILHRCDNPPCVNPDHLRAGTHLENMRDKVQKGRWRGNKKTKHRPFSIITIESIDYAIKTGVPEVS